MGGGGSMCVDILLLSTHKGVTSESCVNKPLVCQIYLKPVDSRIQGFKYIFSQQQQ